MHGDGDLTSAFKAWKEPPTSGPTELAKIVMANEKKRVGNKWVRRKKNGKFIADKPEVGNAAWRALK